MNYKFAPHHFQIFKLPNRTHPLIKIRELLLPVGQAGAQKLLIGHFSSKYEFLDDFITEAQSIFAETHLAIEGITY